MSILKMIALALGLVSACMSSTVMAAENDPADNSNISATIGKSFTLALKDKSECSTLQPINKINLLVNGMDTGLHPLGCNPATKKLTFIIKRELATPSTASNEAWQAMLANPWETVKSDFIRELDYTATQPASTDAEQNISSGKLSLLIARLSYGLFGAALVAALWLALLYLGRNSGMLRDDGNQGIALQHRTYSLGRVQMAWWFAIIMGSYIFIWMMSQDIPAIGSQALLLMGISGATGLTAVGLNTGKQLPIGKGKFFEDILTDLQGVTLHRFQMLATTVILSVMFVIHVATTLTMPEFDGSLLALMGIAGGTYVGFKIPETHVDETNPSAPTTEEHKAGYTPEP